MYNWIEALDRFDDILQKFNKTYGLDSGPQSKPFGTFILTEEGSDVDFAQLQQYGFAADGDRVLVQSILTFSRLLLEKCGNRTLYNSTERLNDLLNTTSLSLLHETLRLTLVLAQRFADRGPSQVHAQFYRFDLEKLQKLATPVPRSTARKSPLSPVKTSKSKDKTSLPKLKRTSTTADPNDFRALAKQSTQPARQEQSSLYSGDQELDWTPLAVVRVVWPAQSAPSVSRPATARTLTSDVPISPSPLRQQRPAESSSEANGALAGSADQSGMQQLELDASDLAATNIEAILQKHTESMPAATLYELLHKLRTAYGLLDSSEARNLLLYIRLTALGIVGQVYSEDELTTKYFDGDSNASARQQLIQQLVELLRQPRTTQSTSLYVQSLAMETLAILSRYRQMSAEILSALAPNSSHGLLISLVQRGLEDIVRDGDATDNDAGDDWRHAIFMMWTIVMSQSAPSSARSTEQYVHKNLITTYASGLRIITRKSLRVHVPILKFLEHIFHQFKDGLQVLNANGAFSIVCETTEKLSKDALDLYEAGNGIPQQWKTPGIDFRVPYMQQYVLRELLGLVKDVSKHQGNHADRALRGFVDSTSLLSAFRLILSHMEEFGAHTWSEVVVATCSFLNNEPTSYTVISEAGIITTLLSTVQPQAVADEANAEQAPRHISVIPAEPSLKLPPIADAIINLANSFGAICLTEAGNSQFIASNVLPKFFELFESPAHLRAIKDANVLVPLGACFDELVRHHPGLKNLVISSIITMVARVRYICKTKLKKAGAGPKIWMQDGQGLYVEGGVEALMAEDILPEGNSQVDFTPLQLPSKDLLESEPLSTDADQSLTRTAKDEDVDGMSALDYARPVIGFLAAFFDTHFLCKETLNAGATDLILDFVTLTTLPVTEDAFSDGPLMQDLTTVVRQMAEEKPFLVFPLLVDRARYICENALHDFIDYQPDHLKCYFGQYLVTKGHQSEMDVDRDMTSSIASGTRSVKGLMNVYCITRVLSEVFTISQFPQRAPHNSILTQVNVADVLSDLVTLFGKLSAACCREEISLLASTSKKWLDATKPGTYSTGDNDVDTILDVSNQHSTQTSDDDGGTDVSMIPEDLKDDESKAAFRNLKTLRYLLTETPASISTLFSRIGSSFSGRKKPETIIKQKLHMVADAVANALTAQLRPSFLSSAFREADADRSKDWRFKYLTVVLSRLRDSLWEESASAPSSAIAQSFVVDCFRRADGLKTLNAIGTEFFDELKLCQVDKPVVFAANAGLKICLELLDDLTRNELISSQQTSYMKNTDKDRPFYFNPNQLLLELRMESLPLARRIWDSEYAEQASADVIRRLAAILAHTLKGENEENVIARPEDFPKLKAHEKRKFQLDRAKVGMLKEKGFDPEIAEEALYRCNVSPTAQLHNAEEYCKAVRSNPRRRRLRIPDDEVRHEGSANDPPVSQVLSPPTAMDIVTGPTATIFEDSSQDEDIPDVVLDVGDAGASQNAATITPNDAMLQQMTHGDQPSSSSAMDLSNILNHPSPPLPPASQFSRQSIDAERESIREQLAERCNNILASHPNLIFDLNDLLSAGAAKLSDETARSWWEGATDLLVTSLLSQDIEGDIDPTQGKKVAATAHLLGLLCNHENFKMSMLKVLQESIDGIIEFLRLPGQKPADEEPYPWIAPILLILEKMLSMDAEPDEVNWTPPTDLDNYSEPKLTHNTVVEEEAKVQIFNKIMEILPKVGKDRALALSVLRVLVILTRDRSIAHLQRERKNLQKLFLMVKQLNGRVNARLQSPLMTILRHVIEDEATIKQIMGTEITAYFKNKTGGRQPDLSGYLRDLNYLALRSPALFVETSNEKIKLGSWSSGHQGVSSPLILKSPEPISASSAGPSTDQALQSEGVATESIEKPGQLDPEDVKPQEPKVPVVEHPDGVVHFLLSELLSYKDVEDKETPEQTVSSDGSVSAPSASPATNGTAPSEQSKETPAKPEKAEKPRFKSDEHPIFMYRCLLLHCLTELLYSYNQTKIEFISFSRKADPQAATPSKARSGVLSYLLNALVSSGYVDKDESIACRKRMATSEWAMRTIVGLCTKTGEKELGPAVASRYSTNPRQVDDNDTEPDLTYVRRFVLDHAIKAFKDALTASESMQSRYGRLLCLAELYNKLITKPAGPEGSVFSNNTSYKRLGRMMLEKNFISVLTSAVSDIDLSFPGAKKVVKFILRPLKELTVTATDLSMNHPDEFPQIIDQTTADTISSASSEVSDLDDDREETPDLYRNSALGILDSGRQDISDSEDDDDEEDEEMEYDEYEEEMDYEEDVPPPNDGEVVSDEELEDALDGAGPMEGLPGDVPMDIEFVVNHHHHHHGDNASGSSNSDDDDEDTSDDDDAEDIEIEMDDEDADIEHDGSEGHHEDGAEDDWEDEDGEEDDVDIDEDIDYPDEEPQPVAADPAAHLTDLLRELNDADLGGTDMTRDVIVQDNDPEDQDDEDQDDGGEDIDEQEGIEYDQPFDMMLDGPDYDENEEWGWDEPPPPVFRRSRHTRNGGMPPFFSRRVMGMNDPDMQHHMLGTRHHRNAPSGRQAGEDGTNPLLQRPEALATGEYDYPPRSFGLAMAGGAAGRGITQPLINIGGAGGPAILTMDGNVGVNGHGAILDAIMGAIQRGDQDFLQNGRIQFNINPPDLRQLLRPPPMPSSFTTRQPREDPQRSASFIPMLTTTRWQEEAQIVFGKNLLTKTQQIQTRVYAALVPFAQQEEKERRRKAEEESKAAAEREAQRKAEENLKKKEDEVRLAQEKAEAEEKERVEAEARATAAAEVEVEVDQAAATEQEEQPADAMEGVEAEDTGAEEVGPEAADQPARRYTIIRGRQLDITGLDIDVEYLEALPEDLREEVITAQYAQRREQAQEQGNDDSAIDQEFLDALPEDIRDEIRAQETAAQRRRDRERARREAVQQAGDAQPGDMEPDDFLATLEPALRRAILAEQPPEILNALNPQHAAEGRAHARSMFFHRMPMARELGNARDIQAAAQREAKRQQIVQLIDKAGVATLLRLMFLHQQGSLKVNLLSILSQVCGNRQTRYEVVSLLLVILKEGSTDVAAIERSLASLSLRAKANGPQKTPQPLRRTLSMQPYTGLSEDVTPMMVVQQCLHTLSHICRQNPHVKSLFLREVDVTSSKNKTKTKGKSKETKTTTHPVNDLISLLDRSLIMDNSGCLQSLAHLLATVTAPLAGLMRQEKEKQKAEREQDEKVAKADEEGQAEKDKTESADDVPMEDVPSSAELNPEAAAEEASANKQEAEDATATAEVAEPEKKRAPFEPPNIAEQNLMLITNIFVAKECGNDTFRSTLETLQSLSHITGTSEKFGAQLTKHVHTLSDAICNELEELLPAIKDAQSSTDVQGAAAARFSASTSDQVKLLRVLQALDYLLAPKKDDEAKAKSILTLSYDTLGLKPLWTKLSDCLSAVEEKGDTISFANILLPLIESLMVVCKHTTLKDAPITIKEAVVTSPTEATYQDDLEQLFFQFTSDHQKILNDIVRQNPKLMQGHFSILVKNSKVLDFDNKRNYFNKQIHSRHHAQRHPQPPLQLNVRREYVFIDSYKALYFKSAEEMKYGKLNIRFNGEEGVDAGGVTREWFQVLARGMFDANYALFQPVASDKTTFHPSTLSRVNPEHLLYFKFIGRIIGKALHEGRVLDCHFSRAVYKRILGKKPNLKDLESNDVDYYKSLVWILENDITDILTEEFCVIEDEFGEEKVIDLIPDGRNIAVAEDNKKEYVQKLVEYRLTESVKDQLDSFLAGFHDIIPAELISIFNEQELELLISGLPEIDVDDWKANTEYHNYNPSSQQVVWYWRIVKAMTNEERAKLLQFITGTSKVPLNGFKELEGVSGLTKCNIHKDPSTNRLPTSHTCFNQLDLPAYESFEIMKQNITTAINLGADYFGFA